MTLKTATFAAGCFWGIQDVFSRVKGVKETAVGYAGGHTENPTYKEVCTDKTGHAESVQVTYNSDEISYEELLEIFWNIHDPTQLNRQGADFGTQYRSVVFCHDEVQKKLAEKSKKEKQAQYSEPIATEIVAAGKFWRAEEYHQNYHEKQGVACHVPNLDAIGHLLK